LKTTYTSSTALPSSFLPASVVRVEEHEHVTAKITVADGSEISPH
jgi:hypothetical protein